MKKNMNNKDRLVRLVFAVILLVSIFLTNYLWAKLILAILALFVFYEALVGWCALYALLGKNTCPIDLKKD